MRGLVMAVGLFSAGALFSGCEDCSFTPGSKAIQVDVKSSSPLVGLRVRMCTDATATTCSEAMLGSFDGGSSEANVSISSVASDSGLSCEYKEHVLVVSADGCQNGVVSFDANGESWPSAVIVSLECAGP